MNGYRYYKFRLYPNKSQKEKIQNYIDLDKKVYNLLLDEFGKHYKETKKILSSDQCRLIIEKFLEQEKDERLNEVNKYILVYTYKKAYQAYTNMIKDVNSKMEGFKYKSVVNQEGTFTLKLFSPSINLEKNKISLPFIPNIKFVKTEKMQINNFCGLTTIIRDNTDCYYACMLFTVCQSNKHVKPIKFLGLDFSLNDLYIDSNGNKPNFVSYYSDSLDKLKKLKSQLDHMVYQSQNYKKQKLKLAKLYKEIENKKTDFMHKESTRLANEYDCIVVEDLDLEDMASGKINHFKKQLNTSYNKFVRMLEYKLKEKGKTFIKVDRYFPSSQLCSNCGYKNADLKDLSIREWTCPKCGAHHNRDVNAAINIEKEGKRILSKQLNH